MQAPIVPGLVYIEERICIELLLLSLFLRKKTVLGILGKLSICGSIELLCVFVLIIIHLDTAGNCHPVCYVIIETCAEIVPVLLVLAKIPVVDPVRVLHCHSSIPYRPVLSVDFAGGIPSLIH